jgi:hypothetical protein
MYDATIGRWLTLDPIKHMGSPYIGMGNNPIIFGDADGRDIIIMNASNGASTYGHNAVLIGDDQNGWAFISEEGNAATWLGNAFTGGPALTPKNIRFKTLTEALKSNYLKAYDR